MVHQTKIMSSKPATHSNTSVYDQYEGDMQVQRNYPNLQTIYKPYTQCAFIGSASPLIRIYLNDRSLNI